MTVLTPPDDVALVARARAHAALGDPVRLAIIEALLDTDLAPDEVADAVDMPSNVLAHHLNVLQEAGLLVRTVSHGDRRRRYLCLRPEGLEGLVTPRRWTARSVLFVCTANAARSQLAVALWSARSPVPAVSAGVRPARSVAAEAVRTAAGHGLPTDAMTTPRGYDAVIEPPGLVVSVCDLAREGEVPFDAPRLHWSIPDPLADDDPAAFKSVLAMLADRVDRLASRVAAA